MSNPRLLEISATIISAHVANNHLASGDLLSLIRSVYSTLASLNTPTPEVVQQEPAVPVNKSVFKDYIICLEDGMKLKMLKRHLRIFYDMSPEQYVVKWGLPKDYPMVAPSSSLHRSNLARSFGLGQSRAIPKTDPEPAVTKVAKGVSSKRKSKAKVSA